MSQERLHHQVRKWDATICAFPLNTRGISVRSQLILTDLLLYVKQEVSQFAVDIRTSESWG